MDNKFLNDASDDDLDARLAEIASEEDLVTKMRRKAKDKPKLDDMSFAAEFSRNWWIYVLLGISAMFTGTLGFVMGLAPYENGNVVTFHDDALHIFLAIAYMVAFIGVTEFAFGLGKWLYFTREQNNTPQTISMIVWMLAAGISIFATGIAGGSVIASFISFMTKFSNVSVMSQEWIVKSIPSLFFFYAILGTVYILSSHENTAKRMVKERQRSADLAHETRVRITKQWGREQVLKTEIKKYMRAVEQGVLSMAEAETAIDQGLSLREMEEKLRRDLDGDNKIGNGPARLPAYASKTDKVGMSDNHHEDPTKAAR